jgi:hypothetical protein
MLVGDLNVISKAMGCGTANIARAFCLITLIVSVTATATAAGAAQETSCASRPIVRKVIAGCSLATLLFSIIAVTLLALLKRCMTTTVPDISVVVAFFIVRPATCVVDSIAFPLYVSVMTFSATALGMSVAWIFEKVGPPAVEVVDEPEVAQQPEARLLSLQEMDELQQKDRHVISL